jgi:CobQ-like glutamine amidotransferase family enzyme
VVVRGLRSPIEGGAAVLGVCAGLQVLGHEFTGPDGETHRGLGVLDCVTRRLGHRAVGECVTLATGVGGGADDAALTGFENHLGATVVGSGSTALGQVTVGVGNGDGTDGAVSGRVIGTYLHGPVLARNPSLADHLLESALGPVPPLTVPEVDRLRANRLSAVSRRRRPGRSRARRP